MSVNKGRQHRAETMYAIIYPFRNKITRDCPPRIQTILCINAWCAPWHALKELAKDIPPARLKAMENFKDER
jgi:hypothetical protein